MTDPQAGYTPMVTEEHARRIRHWHENAYDTARAEASLGQTVTYLGTSLVIPPDVMPITGMSHLLGEAVLAEVRQHDRVLDMGTGSGVNAILAASRAVDVLAVDINPHAVQTARQNAERNGVADRIEVRHSHVFNNVDGEFDLIVFDPPFRWFTPRDQFEIAMTDTNYRAMTEFFHTAKQHLTPTGRMLVFFGTSGDLPYLKHLADKEGFHTETVAQAHLDKDDWTVDYFTFRMTQNRHRRPGSAATPGTRVRPHRPG